MRSPGVNLYVVVGLPLLWQPAVAEPVDLALPAESATASSSAPAQAEPVEPDPDEQGSEPSNPRYAYDFWTAQRLTGEWGGFRQELEAAGIEFGLSYQQAWQQNFRGGRQTRNGGRMTGSYDLDLDLDFGRLGLIPEDRDFRSGFYIKFKGDFNDSIQDLVGSLNDPNADPAGDKAIYARKWWFWNHLFDDKIEIRLGVIQTHKDLFDVSLFANHEDEDFLNRSSFRNPTIPHDAGMGAFIKISPVSWWYFQAATIDAQSGRYNTQFDTSFHGKCWYVGLWETGLTPEWPTAKGSMPGRYRVGFWYDPTVRPVFEDLEEDEEPDMRGHELGFYLGLDQMVFKENDDPEDQQGLGLFARYGTRRGDINEVDCYWQTGAFYQGPLPGRDDDTCGFAWVNSHISEQYRSAVDERARRESVYEWFYSFQLTPAIVISPNLQVFTDPGGSRDARDAIVGGVRFRVVF